MKVGIIGSGIVGRVLAKAFATEGHEVLIGTRGSAKSELLQLVNENPAITIGGFSETAAQSELIVLAVGGSVAIDAIRLAGKEYFTGKILIDVNNPIADGAPVNGVLPYFTDFTESLMEKIQKELPDARVVKAFSCVGNTFFYKPQFPGGIPTMFIAGNNPSAKQIVTDILTAFGWETEDMGMAEAARAIEPLCILWCLPGFTKNQWGHAFKLLKR